MSKDVEDKEEIKMGRIAKMIGIDVNQIIEMQNMVTIMGQTILAINDMVKANNLMLIDMRSEFKTWLKITEIQKQEIQKIAKNLNELLE